MDNPLTPKQRRFVSEYLKDQNGTQAAIRAGYSKKTAQQISSRLLLNVVIRQIIEQKLQKHDITADRVLQELSRLAFSDLRSLYNPDGSLKPVHEWSDDAARAVAGVESEEIFEGAGQDRKYVGDLAKVKLWSKPQTLEVLARHFKLLTDKVEHSGSISVEQLLAGSRE